MKVAQGIVVVLLFGILSVPAYAQAPAPVTFWVGSNHGASIIKLEPLE